MSRHVYAASAATQSLTRLAIVVALGIALYGAQQTLETDRFSQLDRQQARELEHQLAASSEIATVDASLRPADVVGQHLSTARFVYDEPSDKYLDRTTGKLVSRADLPYPPNHGFTTSEEQTLEPGQIVDRFGSPLGRFCGTAGDTISMRGMPAGDDDLPYYRYRIVRPITVLAGPSAAVPDFGATGGGTQYLFPESLQSLVDNGDLQLMP